MKPGPGSRPNFGSIPTVENHDIALLCSLYNESLRDPPAYEFGGGRRVFADYPPGTGIFQPPPWPGET